ncbi:MAG: hypothetical protein IJ150_01180 [Bacteroidales bacterium]|nr:hypothetical protein [Bacteroidales bacterium]
MRLNNVLNNMVFSFLLCLFSCDPESHFNVPLSEWNYMKIYNNTSDSIIYKKIFYDYGYHNGVQRYDKNEGLTTIAKGDFMLRTCNTCNLRETDKEKCLKYDFVKTDDSVIVYLGDKVVSWGGPMTYKADTIHDFFNINSWKQVPNPENDERIILEFYITNDDFE